MGVLWEFQTSTREKGRVRRKKESKGEGGATGRERERSRAVALLNSPSPTPPHTHTHAYTGGKPPTERKVAITAAALASLRADDDDERGPTSDARLERSALIKAAPKNLRLNKHAM